MAQQPADHFKGLVSTLRQDIKNAVSGAQALKARGSQSMSEFHKAKTALASVYDEVDAATAEINGALLGEGSNGGEQLDDLKNSSKTSSGSSATSSGGEKRAIEFSDIHPSLRHQTSVKVG